MSKNTHLEHLEDSILLDGEQGAKDAFMFLDELARVFTGTQSNNFKITTTVSYTHLTLPTKA